MLACVGLLLATLTLPVSSYGASYSEDAVKAAFLYRFAAYVEWPNETPGDTPFTIAVAGADGVAAQLEKLLPGITIKNRSARVVRITEPDELSGAQILYVGPGLNARSANLLKAATVRPVLLVTDDEDGLMRGAVINLVQFGNNVRFEVSLQAAERSRLKISAGLLSVAARVEGRPRADALCGLVLPQRGGPPACETHFANAGLAPPKKRSQAADMWRSRPRCDSCG